MVLDMKFVMVVVLVVDLMVFFQVKGIGITPLLAQNMSKSHSHGKLFLDEAISEAIWGEICHRHLPYGSIRTLAIIKTNVQEEFSLI